MKTCTRHWIGFIACGCLVALVTQIVFNDNDSFWGNGDSLPGTHHMYFTKRQWLADARTLVAVCHYLYESSTASPAAAVPAAVATLAPRLTPRAVTTNFLSLAPPVPS